MKITIEFVGLDNLIKQFESLSSQSEIDALNKRIFQQCANETLPRMKSHIPRSADNSKSGRQGHRPPGHAQDNIPVKVTKKKAEVGWNLKGDADDYFYMKFVEWGTSKMPPRDFIHCTKKEMDGTYSDIAKREYQQALKKKLGG